MKKLAFFLVFITVMFSMLASAFAADERLIEGFDSFENETEYDGRVLVWEGGGAFKLSLSDKRAESGESLRVIPNGTGSDDFGVINVVVPDRLQNWEGAEGMRFWAEATGGTVLDPTFIALEVAFDDSHVADHPERFIGYKQKPYTVIHSDGTTEVRRFGDDGRIVFDDGFKGWVEIPFDSFECAGWSMYDDELNLDKVTKIFFGAACGFAKGKEIYIDSIKLYGENLSDVSTTEPTDEVEPEPTPEPVETEEPAETEQPVETGELVEPVEKETPAEVEEPVEKETPAEVGEPAETETPAEETASPEPEESVEPSDSSVPAPAEQADSTDESDPTDGDSEPVMAPADDSDTDRSENGSMIFIIFGIVAALSVAGAATYFLVIRKRSN